MLILSLSVFSQINETQDPLKLIELKKGKVTTVVAAVADVAVYSVVLLVAH